MQTLARPHAPLALQARILHHLLLMPVCFAQLEHTELLYLLQKGEFACRVQLAIQRLLEQVLVPCVHPALILRKPPQLLALRVCLAFTPWLLAQLIQACASYALQAIILHLPPRVLVGNVLLARLHGYRALRSVFYALPASTRLLWEQDLCRNARHVQPGLLPCLGPLRAKFARPGNTPMPQA
jgi:hypothetical protein